MPKLKETELMIEEYLKFEILGNEHAAQENTKQARYCASNVKEIFNVIDKVTEGRALELINEYSEKHYTAIENKVLKLNH